MSQRTLLRQLKLLEQSGGNSRSHMRTLPIRRFHAHCSRTGSVHPGARSPGAARGGLSARALCAKLSGRCPQPAREGWQAPGDGYRDRGGRARTFGRCHVRNLTRSQTDTKSTQTDTRSQTVVKQTSRSEQTHIRLRRLTALPLSLSPLRTPRSHTGSSAASCALRHPHYLLRTALRLLPRLPLVLPIRSPPGVLQLHSREPHVLRASGASGAGPSIARTTVMPIRRLYHWRMSARASVARL